MSDVPTVDAWVNQYLLALGEFNLDNFNADGSSNGFEVWIIFIMATFISQIIIFNMLVNLTGETLSEQLPKKDQIALCEEISLLKDFAIEYFDDKNGTENKYMYIA